MSTKVETVTVASQTAKHIASLYYLTYQPSLITQSILALK